jgi:hypothetical protein
MRHAHYCAGDVVTHPAFDVDKLKLFVRASSHSFQENGQLFTDILFGSLATSAPHFLYLMIAVACQMQSIGSTYLQRMCIDTLN